MHEFKEGDVVQLKSGTGPTMTIASLENAAGEAICVWVEGKKTQEDIFDLVALEVVNKQKPEIGCLNRP